METGDVQKKDLVEHPENYILLTTLDEGEFSYHFPPFFFIVILLILYYRYSIFMCGKNVMYFEI